jgi:two-component system CheB/CheR fusion protein
VTVTGMTRAEARQQVLIAELQHRTRNLLAVVQSIAGQTLGSGVNVEAFNSRLGALARLQALLGQANNDQVLSAPYFIALVAGEPPGTFAHRMAR